MTFTETVNAIENSASQFDIFYRNCESFIETALNEIDPTVIIEAEDKSSEGALVKVGKAIKELCKKVKEAILNMIQHIKEFFTSKNVKDTLDKADKATKNNPKIKDVKIEIPDYEAINKIYDQGINEVEKKLAEAKSGKNVPEEEFKNILTATEEKAKKTKFKLIGIGALIAAITAGTIVFEKTAKNDIKDVDEVSEGYDLMGGTMQMADHMQKSAGTSTLLKMIHNKSAKASSNLMTMFSKLSGAFTQMKESGSSEVGKKLKKVKGYDTESSVEECANINVDPSDSENYIKSLMEIIDKPCDNCEKKEPEEVTDNDDNSSDAKKTFDEIERECFNEARHQITVGEYLESLEKELFN